MYSDHTSALRGVRCLVTGGAGFIGSNLVRRLLCDDCFVTVLDNFSSGERKNLPVSSNLQVIEGDICLFTDLPKVLRETDYVFHLAAQVGNVKSINAPESDASTNITGSVHLYKECEGTRIRKLVYASSSAIFGEAEQIPIAENHPKKPASFYALSKLTAEKYTLLAAQLWGIPAIAVRFFNVYGLPMVPNEYSGVIPIFLSRFRESRPLTIYGNGQQVRDFVYVDDIVQGLILAALRGPVSSVYNLGTGIPTTILRLAEELGELADVPPVITYEDFRPGEVRQSVADISKAREELGYEPEYTLKAGLSRILATNRSHECN